jgi:hypothetical protein
LDVGVMARVLRWVAGKPCNGVTYYAHAFHKNVKYSLAKMVVDGVEKYMLWKGDEYRGLFGVRLAAYNHADTLI